MPAIVISLLLLFFLGSSIWIGMSLIMVAFLSLTIFIDNQPIQILSNAIWGNTNSHTMMALPLFIFMGEILMKSKISENLFRGLAPWMTFLPGKLIHMNILSSSLFAAVSGSSAATTATVGKITLPELSKRKYSDALSIGSLAGAGTLGFLIPPSLIMIVYGITANVSIGQLFIAGVIPGFLLALIFSLYFGTASSFVKEKDTDEKTYTWSDRIRSLPLILPVIFLILLVLGSIYLGFATPTESAALGVLGAVIIAISLGGMTIKKFKEAMLGSVKTNAMIMLITIAASYFSVVIGYLSIPNKLTEFVGSLNLSAYGLIIILAIMYIILGCLLDGFSIILMSLPLALPLILSAGFDPLWFGIFLVLMIEVSQITPPVGFSLFVINGITDKGIFKIALYAIPSFIIILIVAGIITIFPEIVLWLPELMRS